MRKPSRRRGRKLLPCPFCGGRAAMASWNAMHEYSAYCTKCRAVAGDYEDTEEKAAARWNKRFEQ